MANLILDELRLSLWEPQQRALERIDEYLQSSNTNASALVRMPTGTGKTGVIAVLARCHSAFPNVLVVTPWAPLREQMEADLTGRFWDHIQADPARWPKEFRKILPSTTRQALKETEHKATVFICTIPALQAMHASWSPEYKALRGRVDLVIVDEGHREPAPKWAECVRQIEVPTVLLSATPYRNDHKLFNVDPNYIYAFPHQTAVQDRYIREVQFHEEVLEDSPRGFVNALLRFYRGSFCKIRPSAVHEDRVIVRCETDNEVTNIASLLENAGEKVIAVHEKYEDDSGEGTFRKTVPSPDDSDATFWVHQQKLIEGIDDPRFSLLAIYRPFRNGRALVQQVGRILRNPTRAEGQTAHVFTDISFRQSAYWSAYRAYERNFETDPKRYDALQRFQTALQLQSDYEYFDRTYRRRFDINTSNLHREFRFRRSTSIYVIEKQFSFSEFDNELRDEWKAADLDIVRTERPDKKTCLHVYISYANSPLLLESALIEYRLGFTFYRKEGQFLFFYDSEGNSCEYLAKHAKRIPAATLRKLFAGSDSRLSQVSLMNSDLGRYSIRRRTLHAYSIGMTGPALGDYAHFCSTAHGYSANGDKFIGRYVGFTRGRVSDRAAADTDYDGYIGWLTSLREILKDETLIPVEVFDRFADFVPPPANPKPLNILLDLEDVSPVYETRHQGLRLDTEDICLPIELGEKGRFFTWTANSVQYAVQIAYDPLKHIYTLRCPLLERAYVRNDGKPQNLIGYLNREQSFRVIPETPGTVYAHGQFYQPRLPIGGRASTKRLELLQILDSIDELGQIETEKGVPQPDESGWQPGSIFHLIDSRGARTSLANYFGGIDLLVCDDAGRNEVADFIAGDTRERRVIFIHAKAAPQGGGSTRSASAFAVVCAQAVKNLQFLLPFSIDSPPNLSLWNKPWRTPAGVVARRIRQGTGTAAKIWEQIHGIVRDPSATREVWVVLGNTFSLDEFEAQRSKQKPVPEIVQILYSLQSTWAGVSSVGARLRIFCSP